MNPLPLNPDPVLATLNEHDERLSRMETLLEAWFWGYLSDTLTRETQARAIMLAVGEYFSFHPSILGGAAEIKHGRGYRFPTNPESIRLRTARLWLVVLLKGCIQVEEESMKRAFPGWLVGTVYSAGVKLWTELLREPRHDEHEVWVSLLTLARKHATERSIEAGGIDTELSQARYIKELKR